MDKEKFYSSWNKDKYNNLTSELKNYIYNDYVVDCEILQRDSFTCQNRDGKDGRCTVCKNVQYYPRLTKHHIKAKRNGGRNTARNQVILCNGTHQKYERGEGCLVFSKKADNLPPHIRGHTFMLSKTEKVDWKQHKAKMRKLRKELKIKLSSRIEVIKHLPIEQRRWFDLTIEQIIVLMKCLEVPYWEWNEFMQ